MKKKKTPKIPMADQGPLSDSPFGNLARLTGIEAEDSGDSADTAPTAKKMPFMVRKSKKGNWPISVEKRAGGKKATLLKNIEGDGKELLKQLKKKCACGGDFKNGILELQGDQTSNVTAFLDAL